MNLFQETNWSENLSPILKLYQNKKHPLEYNNEYQLVVMVILSAQDSDANINRIAPKLFDKFPNIQSLANATQDILIPFIDKVQNYHSKSEWIIQLAQDIQHEKNIPKTLRELIQLKGIGRKSANVILREMKQPAEGIICDLHVIRVAPRIGLTTQSKDGTKIEKELMQQLPKEIWGNVGMAISFLGREICRPTQPKCSECPIVNHCQYTEKTVNH